MFLVNVRNYICLGILSLLAFALCSMLGIKSPYFRRLRNSYLFCGAICSIQSGLIDVLLSAAIQLRYVCLCIDAPE